MLLESVLRSCGVVSRVSACSFGAANLPTTSNIRVMRAFSVRQCVDRGLTTLAWSDASVAQKKKRRRGEESII